VRINNGHEHPGFRPKKLINLLEGSLFKDILVTAGLWFNKRGTG
jgi:hypothetical protein